MGCLQTLPLTTRILRSGAPTNYVAAGHSGSIPMDTQRALAVRQMQCGLKLDYPPGLSDAMQTELTLSLSLRPAGAYI